MEIRIHGYVPAILMLEQEPATWHALVMLDSGKVATDFLKTQTLSSACLNFDDVVQEIPGRSGPTIALIEQGLRFASDKPKLLVSCRAGQRRS